MTGTQDSLMAALTRFVEDAIAARDPFRRSGTLIQLLPGVKPFAARLAALPSAEAADGAAMEAARENRYLLHEAGKRRSAGRSLSARALVETGVAGLLLAGGTVDVPALASELAGYLAGPVVQVWDYAIVDANVTLSGPVPVVDGWKHLTPTSDELGSLGGVPSAAPARRAALVQPRPLRRAGHVAADRPAGQAA